MAVVYFFLIYFMELDSETECSYFQLYYCKELINGTHFEIYEHCII